MKTIQEKINDLKKQRNAVILVHNYQLGEVQDIADYLGDSLGLSIEAAKTPAAVIVFCGVHFMAETAKILSPQKMVLMPDIHAGCPMADMITAKDLQELKAKHPKAAVVCYVNTPAEVKAESDYCCTSANAGKVINAISAPEIIFVPDKYLGSYWQSQAPPLAGQAGRKIILWEGYCNIHMHILPENIRALKGEHPNALVLVHPECRTETVALADEVLSTSGMVRFVREARVQEFIIGTETGIIYRMQKENPGKIFYPVSKTAVCPNMKKTNLEKVLWSLEDLKEEIVVPEEIRIRAKKAIERMIEIL
jgi:quinolinate synthase